MSSIDRGCKAILIRLYRTLFHHAHRLPTRADDLGILLYLTKPADWTYRRVILRPGQLAIPTAVTETRVEENGASLVRVPLTFLKTARYSCLSHMSYVNC